MTNPPVNMYQLSAVPVLAKVLTLLLSLADVAAPRCTPSFMMYATVCATFSGTACEQLALGTAMSWPEEFVTRVMAIGSQCTPLAAMVAKTVAIVRGEAPL